MIFLKLSKRKFELVNFMKNSRNLNSKVTTILVVEWCYSFFILFTYIHCKFLLFGREVGRVLYA